MNSQVSPAMKALAAVLEREGRCEFVQVQLRVDGMARFELRHLKDRDRDAAALHPVLPGSLRELALRTGAGAYRPLKTAPSLIPGWVCTVGDWAALEEALGDLYPGALADWYAGEAWTQGHTGCPATPFPEFVARQTGMYRVAQRLSAHGVASLGTAACEAAFCLRRRRWTAPGLPEERPGGKSCVPCWEPCAIVLELARRAARMEQEPRLDFGIGESERATLALALETLLAHPDPSLREGDSSAAGNPRRVRLLLEKLGRAPVHTDAAGVPD